MPRNMLVRKETFRQNLWVTVWENGERHRIKGAVPECINSNSRKVRMQLLKFLVSQNLNQSHNILNAKYNVPLFSEANTSEITKYLRKGLSQTFKSHPEFLFQSFELCLL